MEEPRYRNAWNGYLHLPIEGFMEGSYGDPDVSFDVPMPDNFLEDWDANPREFAAILCTALHIAP